MDEDGTDMLDPNEFETCCKLLRMDLDDDFDANQAFLSADVDNSGYVNFGFVALFVHSFLCISRSFLYDLITANIAWLY